MEDARIAAVTAAEEARCRALVAKDIDALRSLLSPDLSHTHTGGNTEDEALYLSLLQGPMQYIAITRRDTSVRLYGSIAVMTGRAEVIGRMGEGEPMKLDVTTLQVWQEAQDGWRMVAYQATRIA